MNPYRMTAILLTLAAVLLASPSAVAAQTNPTVRVTRTAVLHETPRGDSVRVGSAQPGEIYEVIGRRENWLLVTAPDGAPRTPWLRGWIHAGSVELVSGSLQTGAAPRARGRFMLRGFGQAGGTVFDARDSFDTLIGSTFGMMSGGGGQVVFPNGVYAQGSFDRFRKTGSRVLVSGNQLFMLDSPTQLTVTPILGTVGYRAPDYSRFAPYVGGGIGWHSLREESPGLAAADWIDEGKLGYHVVGGIEFPVARFLAVAGEAQYATVPKALGETGVSAVYGEENLGGATFRFKLILGY
jgi:opacity protein-like surface antigen